MLFHLKLSLSYIFSVRIEVKIETMATKFATFLQVVIQTGSLSLFSENLRYKCSFRFALIVCVRRNDKFGMLSAYRACNIFLAPPHVNAAVAEDMITATEKTEPRDL